MTTLNYDEFVTGDSIHNLTFGVRMQQTIHPQACDPLVCGYPLIAVKRPKFIGELECQQISLRDAENSVWWRWMNYITRPVFTPAIITLPLPKRYDGLKKVDVIAAGIRAYDKMTSEMIIDQYRLFEMGVKKWAKKILKIKLRSK